MGKKDPKIDAYIQKSADFAKPILHHLRKVIHTVCPDVQEKIKWSFPTFSYKDEMLCHMASFKNHCAFGFWKASLMSDKALTVNASTETAMGHLGKITSLKDLPSDAKLTRYIREAMKLNDDGIKVTRKAAAKAPSKIPPALTKALKQSAAAGDTFAAFSPSHKKEYVEWINEAKTEATRNKRIATTVEWLEQGKIRNWKYIKK